MNVFSSIRDELAVVAAGSLAFVLCSSPCLPASASGHVLLQPDASFYGEETGDWASLTSYVGDVNGDGLGDFVVSVNRHGQAGYHSGKVYLWFGSEGAWAMDTSLSLADASFVGEAGGDYAGVSIDFAGDYDGDGFDDFVVGAMSNDEGGSEAGKTYVIYGHSGSWSSDVSLAETETSFIGENSGDGSGQRVAGVGDVNGDGFDDVVISAGFNDEGGTMAGQAYLLLGGAQRPTTGISLAHADASAIGEADDWLGWAIAGGGDLDGDGLDDYALGAHNYDNERGRIRLVFGKETGWQMDVPHDEADAYFHGEYTQDSFGTSASIVGDVDGDGLDDLLVGAHEHRGGGHLNGSAYLLYGRSQGWPADGSIDSYADVSFQGETDFEYAGHQVGSAGDVNGDSLADFLIRSWSNEGGENAGQAYLVFGRTRGWEAEESLSQGDASLIGEDRFDGLGSVQRNGDLDGDGYSDVLIGAYGNSEFGSGTGQIYLVLGSECWDIDWDGYDSCSGDCDNEHDLTYPGAPEQCDGEDNDCDGTVDEGTDEDDDGDGFTECDGDCDDFDALRSPGVAETCNGVDDDCDGELMADEVDEDLDGIMECEGDCDDEDDSIFPGAEEICGDHDDNDCDGETDEDCGDDDDDDVVDDDDDSAPGDDDSAAGDDDSAPQDDDDDFVPGDDDDQTPEDCDCDATGSAGPTSSHASLFLGLMLLLRRLFR
jgi:hypothetical protein